MQILKPTQNTIHVGNYYSTIRNNFIVYIKEISSEYQRCFDDDPYREYHCPFYKVDIYDCRLNLLAKDSVITYDEIENGRLKLYIPNLNYDASYLGNINAKRYPKELKLWNDMLTRCYKPMDKCFPYIGAMGTIVCDRWLCFKYFLVDIKHMEGWAEAKEDFYYSNYIVDLYDTQRHIPPNKRIYGPGLVKLKKFKYSDICKYINTPYQSDMYPKNTELGQDIMKGKVSREVLFENRSGLDFKLDLSSIDFYNSTNSVAAMYLGYNYYANQLYLNNQIPMVQQPYHKPMVEMCTIVDRR